MNFTTPPYRLREITLCTDGELKDEVLRARVNSLQVLVYLKPEEVKTAAGSTIFFCHKETAEFTRALTSL